MHGQPVRFRIPSQPGDQSAGQARTGTGLRPEAPGNPGRPHPPCPLYRVGGIPGGRPDRLVALLPIEEQVLGPEDSDTPAARGNLAYWTKKAHSRAGRGPRTGPGRSRAAMGGPLCGPAG